MSRTDYSEGSTAKQVTFDLTISCALLFTTLLDRNMPEFCLRKQEIKKAFLLQFFVLLSICQESQYL